MLFWGSSLAGREAEWQSSSWPEDYARGGPKLQAQLRLSVGFVIVGISVVTAHGWPRGTVRDIASVVESLSFVGTAIGWIVVAGR